MALIELAERLWEETSKRGDAACYALIVFTALYLAWQILIRR